MVEDIGFEKPTVIENVTIEVQDTDIENPMEVENVVASSVDGILSRELAPKLSKKNSNIEETEDAENDEAEGDRGGDDDEVLEEDAKGGSLGEVDAVKDYGGMELVEQDVEGVISVVEPTLVQTLEPKSENNVLGDENIMASPDASEGGEKGELKREREEEVDAMVEANVAYKMIAVAKTIVDEEEKHELESEKGEVLDYGGGDGGKLGEDKEVKFSAISDKVALFAKVSGELDYEKEANSDIVVVRGEEAQKESIEKYVYIEDVAAKAGTMVVRDGSINEVDPSSQEGVIEDSSEKDQNVEGQANASKAMEDVRVEKPLYVEVATKIENIGVKNLIEIENVAIAVEDVDVEKQMEVENVVASSADGIISRDLATESSKENNDVEEAENDTEVVDHEEEVLNDNIIETMTNVTDADNDEVEGDGEGDDARVVEEAEEDAKDKSFEEKSMKDVGGTEPTIHDKELDISMVELVSVLLVESKLEHGEFGEEEDAMASPDAAEDEDKDELEEEENVGVMVGTKVVHKVADDEKLEPEGEKDNKVGHGGVDSDELGKKKEVEVFAISVDTAKQEDRVVPFVEGSGELDYDKIASDDIVPMEDEKVVEELIEKDVDVEDETVKPEPVREASTMVVHDGSVEVADSTSVNRVLKNSTEKEQNAEGQETVSKVLEDASVQMMLEVENIAIRVEDIGIEKSTKVEHIIVEVEVVDVKKSMEDGNVAPSCDDAILSRELAPKSNKEKNDGEKTQVASEVTDHGEETDDDGLIEALKNVIDTENDKTKCDRGGDYYREVQDVEEGTKDWSLDAAEDLKDDDENKSMVQDVEVAISVVEPPLALVAESHSENSELGEEDATMTSLDDLEGDDKSEFCEEHEEKEVGDVVEVKIVYKLEDDAKVTTVEQEKSELEAGKGDKVGYGGGDISELSKEKEANVSIEAAETEVKVALILRDKGVSSYKRERSDYTMVVGGEEASKESIGKDVAIEDEAAKPKPASDASIEVVHDGNVMEFDLASADSVLEDSPDKEQNAEGMATASEVMEDIGVKKLLGNENIIDPVEGINVENPIKVENVVVSSVDGILFQDLAPKSSTENNDAGEMEVATEVVDHANEINGDIRIKALMDNENGVGNEADYGANSNTSGSSYSNTTFSSQDDSRILIMDRPATLGSSSSSLLLTPPHQTAQSKILNTSELGLTDDQIEEMNEEDKMLHDKVELIRVKFLRLVYRLGATLEETIAAKVMYRLSLAEGIIHGWQTNRAFNFDNSQKKALILETEGKEDLNFSCNILVLGKTGVGKSATINSIFGEEKLKIDAFSSATTSVQEIVGDVHGVKIRIIDTPGLLPNIMDQTSNRKILVAVKKYTKKCPPDIVLYVDRLDCLSRDLNDLPLLKTITDTLGSSIWFNAIVALTHSASPPEGLNGTPMPYEVLMAQSSHIIQQSIRQATRDMSLMNPVTLVENHPSCRQNSESQKVHPNDQSWRHQMLLLCYSAKILSEANSLLMLQDPNPKKLFGCHFHSLPLHFLLSSLLQSRGDIAVENDQDPPPKNVSVPLSDMTLPSSFDCDNPTYRYRFVETTSTVLARPILDAHGWDHDCGYDGISMEDTLAILNRFLGNVEVQVTKNKKEFNIHLDSSIAAQHGENASSLAGFDIHTVGQKLAYILRGETKIKNIKNKTTGGFSVTFLGDIVATGLKVEDQLSLGRMLSLVASIGAMRAQGDTAYGANLEARLKDKDYPIGQSLSTLGISLMKWHQNLALGANLQSQFSIGRDSKMALRLGLNNKLSGHITVKTSTSEQIQIALLGLVPVAASIYRSFRPREP
ncbi:unnamed protein product [Urochloa decumbens]|uniref:AIG1-type G domain-containing protein n=1 Tax=Urochloa decumbens TaxID=240449 RepID=A0ABC9GPE5_9POAL